MRKKGDLLKNAKGQLVKVKEVLELENHHL